MTDSIEQELAGLAGRGLKLVVTEPTPGMVRAAFVRDDGVIRLAATRPDRNSALEALRIAALQTPGIGSP
jgi:hypothetical protein